MAKINEEHLEWIVAQLATAKIGVILVTVGGGHKGAAVRRRGKLIQLHTSMTLQLRRQCGTAGHD